MAEKNVKALLTAIAGIWIIIFEYFVPFCKASVPTIELTVPEEADSSTGWIPFKFGAIDTTVPMLFRIKKAAAAAAAVEEAPHHSRPGLRPHPHGNDPIFPDVRPPNRRKPPQPILPFGDQIHGHQPRPLPQTTRLVVQLIDGFCRGDRFGLFLNEQQVGQTTIDPDGGYDGCRTNVTVPDEAWDRRSELRMSWLEYGLDEKVLFKNGNRKTADTDGETLSLTVLESPRGGGTGFLRLYREPLQYCICDDWRDQGRSVSSSSRSSSSSSDSDSSSSSHCHHRHPHGHRHHHRRRRQRRHQHRNETEAHSHHHHHHHHHRNKSSSKSSSSSISSSKSSSSNTSSSSSSGKSASRHSLSDLKKCQHSTSQHIIIMTKLPFKQAARACRRIGTRLANISKTSVRSAATVLQNCLTVKFPTQRHRNSTQSAWIGRWEGHDEREDCLELLVREGRQRNPSGSVNIPNDCSAPKAVICEPL